jgi:MoxR-like ATPase
MDSAADSHGLEDAAGAVRAAIDQAARDLAERRTLCELVALAAVAREHLLVVGPVGTAKSAAVRRIASSLGGRYFEYLLSRFTEPSEIFGPIDLRKLRDGIVETQTAGMLPEAEVVFLDEVFLGSTAILNTLLGLLNERVFRRGSSELRVPLRVCVGASNALPGDEMLAAFADRFLLRAFVEPVADAQLESLLELGWAADRSPALAPLCSLAEVDRLASAASAADPQRARPLLADIVRQLRAAGIALSDRRVVKLQRLVAAAAVLDGRSAPGAEDLWPVVYALPSAEAQALGRDVLRDALDRAQSHALAAAAESASHAPQLRAQRLTNELATQLATLPSTEDDGARSARLEALLREVDAAFARDQLPAALAAQRQAAAHALEVARAADAQARAPQTAVPAGAGSLPAVSNAPRASDERPPS